jgi:hypothetical protein
MQQEISVLPQRASSLEMPYCLKQVDQQSGFGGCEGLGVGVGVTD